MYLAQLSGEYRLVDDPELRFTPSGKAVANVRLVTNSRRFNKDSQEWEDDKVLWMSGTVWGSMAENVAESLRKGDLVVVIGKLQTQEWTDNDNNKRSKPDLIIDHIGPSLQWATAKVTKAERAGGQGGTRGSSQSSGGSGGNAAAEDPWASPPPSDEPPF